MTTIATTEVQRLGQDLLQELLHGENFVLTHEGRAIAEVKPIAGSRGPESKEAIAREIFRPLTEQEQVQKQAALNALAEFRETHSLGGLTYRELIDEGRKY